MLSLMSYKHIDFVAQRDQYSIGSLQRLMIADGGDSVTQSAILTHHSRQMLKQWSLQSKTGSEFIDIASMNPVQKIAVLIATIPPPCLHTR